MSDREKEIRLKESDLEVEIRRLPHPVLSLYDRTNYDLVILNHKQPYISLDSGVILYITTGLFADAESDDEILGYVAHEVAHEYFAEYSDYTKVSVQTGSTKRATFRVI